MKSLRYEDKGSGDYHSIVTRGQTNFRHVQISWTFTDQFGLSIAHLRCGICALPLESMALRLGDEIYLLCEDGHLVGAETDPYKAEEAWAAVQEKYHAEVEERKEKFARDYQYLLAAVKDGSISEAELRDWQNDVPSYKDMPQFAKRHEYNQKLEELTKLFKESYFLREKKRK